MIGVVDHRVAQEERLADQNHGRLELVPALAREKAGRAIPLANRRRRVRPVDPRDRGRGRTLANRPEKKGGREQARTPLDS